jgi:hypothetical protein
MISLTTRASTASLMREVMFYMIWERLMSAGTSDSINYLI